MRVLQEHNGERRMEHSSPRAADVGPERLHCAVAVAGSVGEEGQQIATDVTWMERLSAQLKARRMDGETVENEEEEGRRAGSSCLWHALQRAEGACREDGLAQSWS